MGVPSRLVDSAQAPSMSDVDGEQRPIVKAYDSRGRRAFSRVDLDSAPKSVRRRRAVSDLMGEIGRLDAFLARDAGVKRVTSSLFFSQCSGRRHVCFGLESRLIKSPREGPSESAR